MPKYLSGRAKRTPQDKLSADRYQYLALDQAEPNIGDPINPSDPSYVAPPTGAQYQLVSVISNPGDRYWVPITGGTIPGVISVYDEGTLVGSANSINQLNFVGLAITANANPLGFAATITVSPPGPNGSVLFKESDEFATSPKLVFNSSVGIITVANGLDVGIGRTIFNAIGVGDSSYVGIGTDDPTQNLHLDGNLRITKTIYDVNNDPGNIGELLLKGVEGLEWTSSSSLNAGAGGTYYEVQYHNSAGVLDGSPNFVWNNTSGSGRVGIGSTQPTALLDVVGVATFKDSLTAEQFKVVGFSTFLNRIDANGGIVASTARVSDLTNGRVVFAGSSGELQDDSDLTFDGYTLASTGISVSGITTTANLKVTSVANIGDVQISVNKVESSAGNLLIDAVGGTVQIEKALFVNNSATSTNKDTGSIVTNGGVGIEENLNVGGQLNIAGVTTLASSGGITTTGGDLYVGGDLYIGDDVVFDEGRFERLIVSPGIATFKGDVEFHGSGGSKSSYWDKSDNSWNFFDNVKTKWGNSGDLEVFHDSNNSYIKDVGTGDLIIQGAADVAIQNSSSESSAVFNTDGGVELYWRGVSNSGKKFETNSNGAIVYNNFDVEGLLDVDGNASFNANVTLGNQVTDEVSFTGKVATNVLPKTTTTYDLGSDSNRWNTVYANEFNVTNLVESTEVRVEQLLVTGIATFKDDVEFHGKDGTKELYWDKDSSTKSYLRFLDGVKLTFGSDGVSSEGLRIWNAANSPTVNTTYIDGSYTKGSVYVWGGQDGLFLQGKGGESSVSCFPDLGVQIAYNGNTKIETSPIGVLVSGTTTTTDLKVTGDVDSNLIPKTNATYTLGTTDKRWDIVWANRIEGLTNVDIDHLYVTGIATFKDDVQFHGVAGVTSAFWDKSDNRLKFNDEARVTFGTGKDLEIYHTNELRDQVDSNGDSIVDGRTTYIREKGSGGLIFKTDGADGPGAFQFYDSSWKPLLKLHSGNRARAALFFNGVQKLETTQAGILVGGGITAYQGGLTIGDSSSLIAGSGDIVTDGGSDGIFGFYNTTNDGSFNINMKDSGSSQITMLSAKVSTGIIAGANITPDTDGTRDLGSLSKKWDKVYAQEFVGAMNAIVASATTATNVVGGIASVTQLHVSPGISTFKGDVEFWGNAGIAKSVYWDKSADTLKFDNNVKATFGDGATNLEQLKIYSSSFSPTVHFTYIDGSQTKGGVYIYGGDDGLYLQGKSGEGSVSCIPDAEVQIFYDNVKKIETTQAGVLVSGTTTTTDLKVTDKVKSTLRPDVTLSHDLGTNLLRWNTVYANEFNGVVKVDAQELTVTNLLVSGIGTFQDKLHLLDNDVLHFGGSLGEAGDLQVYHNSSTGTNYIDSRNGHVYIRNNTVTDLGANIYLQAKAGQEGIVINDDESVDLFYNGSQKFETTNIGTKVTGQLQTTGDIDVDGDSYLGTDENQTAYINARVDTDIIPKNNGTKNLGAATKKWGKIYAEEFVGESVGNVAFATTATNVVGGIASVSQLVVGEREYLDGATPGISTFYGDVKFFGNTGVTSSFWDQSANSLNFVDDVKVVFGDGSNKLNIYSKNESNNYIDSFNTNLELRLTSTNANQKISLKPNSGEDGLVINYQGSVQLYHSNTRIFDTSSQGVSVRGTTVGAGISFYEATANGTHNIKIKSPDTLAASYTLTLPPDDGEPGELLKSDGNGNLDWISVASVGADPGGSDTEVQYNDNESFNGMTNFTYNKVSGDITIGGDAKNAVWDKSADTLKFDADAKIQLGADANALQIYNKVSDGNNYIKAIKGAGTSNLFVDSVGSIYLRQGNTEPALVCNHNGSTDLHFNGSVQAKLKTNINGVSIYGNSGVTAGTLQLYNKNDDKKVSLTIPDIGADYTLTLPANDGGSNEVLTTDGNGILSWTAKGSSSGGTSPGGSETQVQFHDTGATFGGMSNFTYNKSTSDITFTGTSKNVVWDFSANAFHFDNDSKATFGNTSSDPHLLIEANGSSNNTNIRHNNSASSGLYLLSNKRVEITDLNPGSPSGHIGLRFNYSDTNHEIELFYNNVKKFETTDDGVKIIGKTTAAATLDLYEAGDNGGGKIRIKSPDAIGSEYTFTLPPDAGDENDVLRTDGSGTLTWVPQSGGGGSTSPSGSDKQLQFNDNNVLAGTVGLEWNKTPGTLTQTGSYIRSTKSNGANFAEIHSDGGIELKRSDESETGGGPYIDFKYSSDDDMDARIQMETSSGSTSNAAFSAIKFLTGGDGLAADGGDVEERLRIGKAGEIGIDAGNGSKTAAQIYGESGQVLKSGGGGNSVYWSNEAGGGSGSNYAHAVAASGNNILIGLKNVTDDTTDNITLVKGSGISFSAVDTTLKKFTISADSQAGTTYDLSALLSPGIKLTGSNGTNDSIFFDSDSTISITRSVAPGPDGGGTIKFSVPAQAGTTYTLPTSQATATSPVLLKLTPVGGAAGANQTVTISPGDNITLTENGQGFTINAADGAGLGINANISDLLSLDTNKIKAVDAGGSDKIFFWDDSANKATYLSVGGGLQIIDTEISATGSSSNTTYTLPCSGTNGTGGAVGGSGLAKITLKGSDDTTDVVQFTSGKGIVLDSIVPGGFRISADVADGGGITNILVTQDGRSGCTNPITVAGTATKVINITNGSNAYGTKYVQTADPSDAATICNGDIWYDTSESDTNQEYVQPVGAIIAYGGSSAPSGWLLCNGQSTSGYAALASIVGSNVPNYTSKDLYPYIIKT